MQFQLTELILYMWPRVLSMKNATHFYQNWEIMIIINAWDFSEMFLSIRHKWNWPGGVWYSGYSRL